MGFRDLLLFYIVTGFSVRWIAQAAHAGPSALVIWGICCVAFYLPLAACVLALSSRYPSEGGIYVWSNKAFGGFAGFITGWTYWVSNLPYYPALLAYTALNALYLAPHGHALDDSRAYFMLAPLVGLALAVWPNILGLGVGKWLHNAGALGLWVPAMILIVMGLVAGARFGSATPINAHAIVPSTHLNDIIFWSTIAFSMTGLEGASIMGDEIRDARRNVPRALIIAGVIITLVYVLSTLAVMLAIPAAQVTSIQGIMEAITSVARRLDTPSVVFIVAALITLGGVGQAGAWFAASARLPFVAGLDCYLPGAFGRIHPRWGSPWVALLVQAAIAVLFIFLSIAGTTTRGAYDVLVSVSVLWYFIPYLFMFAAFIKLQRTPVAIGLALMGLATTVVSIFLSMVPTDQNENKLLAIIKVVGSTIVMLLIGVALYVAGESRRRRLGIQPATHVLG